VGWGGCGGLLCCVVVCEACAAGVECEACTVRCVRAHRSEFVFGRENSSEHVERVECEDGLVKLDHGVDELGVSRRHVLEALEPNRHVVEPLHRHERPNQSE
jgi:hypothetical protein